MANQLVSITKTGGTSATASATSVTTGSNGTATFTVTPDRSATGQTTFSVSVVSGQDIKSDTLTVNVAADTPSVTAAITPTNGTVSVNSQLTMVVNPTPTTAAYDKVEWTATGVSGAATINNSITVKNQAVLFGTKSGTVSITATLKKSDGSIVATAPAVTVTVTTDNSGVKLTGTPTTPFYLEDWSINSNGYSQAFTAYPTLNGTTMQNNSYTATYTWYLNNKQVQSTQTPIGTSNTFTLNPYYHSLEYGNTANKLTCTATITPTNLAPVTTSYEWTIYTGYNNYLASVSIPNSYTYALGDRDDAGNSSIVDQLASRYNYNTGYGTLSYVKFRTTTHTYGTLNASTTTSYYPSTSTSSYYTNYLGNVVFTPSGGAGKAVFTVELYYTNSTTPLSGTICIDTSGTTTTGDINYAASIGDTQYFNAADFESLYYDKTNGGTLSYVTFSTPSSGTGTLYADGVRLSTGTYCYASPSSRQTALDSVYFTPSGSTATRAGTVRIGFTAYGNRGSSSSYYNRTITGTVVINYLNGTAKDITYTPVGGSVTLKASDFTDKYREVVGSNAPSDLTIQFQDVPANGSLSYRNSSSSSSSTVSLRSSNIKSYRFTTRTSGANQLGDVTYTSSGTRSDTISYIAYSGSTARFSGKVVFNPNTASTTLTVGLPCTGSAGVAFNAASFTLANPAVMANCSQIRFMAPTNGTLTYAGAAVSYSGVTVLVSMLGQIHYKPNAGFNNNTDRVAFICYDAAGNQIGSGQVNIVVSGNTGGASGGVTNIGGFTDLPKDGSGDWYMSVLSSLVSRGIVQGTGNGKAEPRGKLNYGQALKMILLAANYPAQTEVAGNDWAINYKNLAVQNGLISSSVVLTDPITRDAVVELAAKALKIAPVTGNSPFKDSNNGYAIALNRTSPQIIVGNANGTFNGSGTLLRQEVWMIIYRMYEYSNSQSSTQMPDGI